MALPRHYVRVRDLDLAVADEGQGEPVLLLHGFPDRAEMWRHVAERLRAAGRRTIVPDLVGFGESSAPPGLGAYRIGQVVTDLEQLLGSLGVDGPVDVVGHDWGAGVSWAMATTRPERVRRHVALSVGHLTAFMRAGLDQKRRSTYMLVWQVPVLSERLLAQDNFRRFRDIPGGYPDIEQAVADLSRPGRLTAGLKWYRANVLPSLFRRLPRCTVPTLGMLGSEDPALGEEQMVASGRYMDAPWRYERLEGSGHWLSLDAPDRVSELALEWFEQTPG